MDGLNLLVRLLDANAPQVSVLPRFGRAVGNNRKRDRQEEYVAVAAPIVLQDVMEYADQSVSAEAIQRMAVFHAETQRIVPFARVRHSQGELAHYFDGICVLSGVQHERLVCYRVGESRFVALHYCADDSSKDAYSAFLVALEKRWYHIKSTAQNL